MCGFKCGRFKKFYLLAGCQNWNISRMMIKYITSPWFSLDLDIVMEDSNDQSNLQMKLLLSRLSIPN